MTGFAEPLEPAWRRSRPYATASGILIASSGLPVAVAQAVYGPLALDRYGVLGLVGAIAACLVAGGVVLPRHPSRGRILATSGVLGLALLACPLLRARPLLALLAGLGLLTILGILWNAGGPSVGRMARRDRWLQSQARGASLAALCQWIFLTLQRSASAPAAMGALCMALLLAVGLGLAWAILERGRHPLRAGAHAAALAAAALLVGVRADLGAVLDGSALLALTSALALPGRARTPLERSSWWEPLLGHPERLFVGTFGGLCALGTIALALPASAEDPAGIDLIDAAFTAVSAVCVTGLIVRDTAHEWSPLGQAAILLLIQLGGLGIMTFSTTALRVLGRRMTLRHERAVARLISPHAQGQIFVAAQRVLVFTLVCELVGTAALLARFLAHGDGFGTALWRALFTAISAFCNAGFALQIDSLVSYRTDPWILHVVAGLIVLGGLAPAAVLGLPALLHRTGRPVSAQVKLSLATTALLVVLGFGLLLSFEWSHALAELSPIDRVHNAWFQSVTLRTAGFNSIDLTELQAATITLMLVMMFIGGSPGGTAGGIKTTTAAVLLLGVVSSVRGQPETTVFSRRIPPRTLQRALAVATLGVVAVLAGIFALELTQDIEGRDLLFEVVSASATVGLSLGATLELDEIGKLIVIGCMFAGRVGPLTLLMLVSQPQTSGELRRPEEDVDVG